MEDKKAKDIWDIWKETSPFRKKNLSNYVIVALFGLVAIVVISLNSKITRSDIQSILGILLGLNGAILGLIVAGYSFSNAVPKELMAFFASTKAKDYPWSNFKQILLNYLYCFTVLFTGILIFCFFYLCAFIDLRIYFPDSELPTLLKKIMFALIWLVEGFILSELKIFLFWIYDNSLTLAQAVTVSEDLEPFDE